MSHVWQLPFPGLDVVHWLEVSEPEPTVDEVIGSDEPAPLTEHEGS